MKKILSSILAGTIAFGSLFCVTAPISAAPSDDFGLTLPPPFRGTPQYTGTAVPDSTSSESYPAKVAAVETGTITLNGKMYTKSYEYNSWYTNWNWNNVSPISDFFDDQGRYTIAYSDDSKIYVSHINDSLAVSDTVTFAKPMPLIGGVTCDSKGNFYVACGQRDEEIKAGTCTFAVYKYSSDGKYVGKAEYHSEDISEGSFDTREPFQAGNCAMTFSGNILVCSYARLMYSGHQSNGVFCVNIDDMSVVNAYQNYCSHSFNQSVITLNNGVVAFANHGDAFQRGFQLEFFDSYKNSLKTLPFTFYGKTGDNYTFARLTGISELDTGVALIGSSVKSFSEEAANDKQQMFLQIINPADGTSVLDASSRENGDTGILWLTDYTDGSEVRASAAVALDTSRLLVMWEKWDVDGKFVGSYYSIISSDGEILSDSVFVGKIKLNGAEELKRKGNFVYWVYSEGEDSTAQVYRLDTERTVAVGDIDGNNTVNTSDALMAIRAYFRKIELTPAQFAAADIDGNGKVDTNDALLMIRIYFGKIVLE